MICCNLTLQEFPHFTYTWPSDVTFEHFVVDTFASCGETNSCSSPANPAFSPGRGLASVRFNYCTSALLLGLIGVKIRVGVGINIGSGRTTPKVFTPNYAQIYHTFFQSCILILLLVLYSPRLFGRRAKFAAKILLCIVDDIRLGSVHC